MQPSIHFIYLSIRPLKKVRVRPPAPYQLQTSYASDTLRILTSRFPTDGDFAAAPHAYHPALAQLYSQYANALYSTCSPFTRDPHELAYVAAAQWPSFISPVVEAQKGVSEFHPIPEDVRLRLLRVFLPSLTAALHVLLPRRTHARAWSQMPDLNEGPGVDERGVEAVARSLPTLQKYILLASFLASSNPPRTDMRMFSRSRETQSKRRRGGTPRKTPQRSTSAPTKVGLSSVMHRETDRTSARSF